MNRNILKILSCGLAVLTFCNLTNVSANPIKQQGKNGGLSTAAKVCIGIGAGAVALIAGGAIWYAIDHRGEKVYYDDVDTRYNPRCNPAQGGSSVSGKNSGGSALAQGGLFFGGKGSGSSAPAQGGSLFVSGDYADYANPFLNANLSNTHFLCYWHSLIQQMYSLKTFREFVDNANLIDLDQITSSRVAAFKEFFKKMGNNKSIGMQECLDFAQEMLGEDLDGEEHDIHEALFVYIRDVFEAYNRYCCVKYHTKNSKQRSNVLLTPIKLEKANNRLQDLLNTTDNAELYRRRREVVDRLLTDSKNRQSIFKAYVEHFGNIKVPSNQVVDLAYLNGLQLGSDESRSRINRLRSYFVPGGLIGEDYSAFLNSIANELCDKIGCVKDALDGLESVPIDVPVLDDQFVLFVNRTTGWNGDIVLKNRDNVDFGDGTVQYKGSLYEITAVSSHIGSSGAAGHYITYKKGKDGNWYCYNDADVGNPARVVSFEFIKDDAQDGCTMFTFSKVK